MKLGTFIGCAAGTAVIGFLGFRIIDLEQRVALLVEQTGTGVSADAVASSAAGPVTAGPPRGYEQRISALEKRVDALAKQVVDKHRPGVADLRAGAMPQEQTILSVVERENSRIRDVQLEWHRARWLETRDQQLAAFATSIHLQPDQTTALRSVLAHERNEMVSVLKRPGLAEAPDQAAADWQATSGSRP